MLPLRNGQDSPSLTMKLKEDTKGDWNNWVEEASVKKIKIPVSQPMWKLYNLP